MATWMWHFGEFEIHRHLLLSSRREERGHLHPVVWAVSDCCKNITFHRTVNLDSPEQMTVYVDGIAYIEVDGARMGHDEPILLDKGEHCININVMNVIGLPSAYVEGKSTTSGRGWLSCKKDFSWLTPVGYWNLDDVNCPPSKFSLPVRQIEPASVNKTDKGTFIDFGRETFVKLQLKGTKGELKICYGESIPEAMDFDRAPVRQLVKAEKEEYLLPARACRYVNIEGIVDSVTGYYEYLPLEKRGAFSCDDELVNKIWDVSLYTLQLTSREMFIDGIKRDRWVWSGDAFQSYLMNYYSFFDMDINKRTMIALRGNEPLSKHINTIMDYTFYWLMSFKDYYRFTGDSEFLVLMYDRMKSAMDFCMPRFNDEGLAEGRPDDWIFIDWADMEKQGCLCAEQMLLSKAFESLALCAELAGDKSNSELYKSKRTDLDRKIKELYWDEEQGGFVTTYTNGKRSKQIRRHANIFAILLGFADREMTDKIVANVLLNDNVPQLTTPYFKFYEMEALCKIGRLDLVTSLLRSYWGGMLENGATSFWEEFNPELKGDEHYAMYGNPYDKSLCHAWGASPLYLLGRYYLGVEPLCDGYGQFVARPNLGGFGQINGIVPTMKGNVHVFMDEKKAEILSEGTDGILVLDGMEYKVNKGEKLVINR